MIFGGINSVDEMSGVQFSGIGANYSNNHSSTQIAGIGNFSGSSYLQIALVGNISTGKSNTFL